MQVEAPLGAKSLNSTENGAAQLQERRASPALADSSRAAAGEKQVEIKVGERRAVLLLQAPSLSPRVVWNGTSITPVQFLEEAGHEQPRLWKSVIRVLGSGGEEGETVGEWLARAERQKREAEEERERVRLAARVGPPKTLTEELQELLEQGGTGLTRTQHVPKLISLMREEISLRGRSILITVLMETSATCREEFLKCEGLKVLEEYLKDARDDGKPSFVNLILEVLQRLPVSVAHLQGCGIGKIVNKLQKATFAGAKQDKEAAVRSAAQALVAQWKRVVTGPPKAAAAVAVATAAAEEPKGAPAAKRPAPAPAPAAPPPAKRPKPEPAPAPEPVKKAPAASKAKPEMILLQAEDDDLFGGAGAGPRKAPAAPAAQRLRVGQELVKKHHGAKRIDVPAPTRQSSAAAAASPRAQAVPAQLEPASSPPQVPARSASAPDPAPPSVEVEMTDAPPSASAVPPPPMVSATAPARSASAPAAAAAPALTKKGKPKKSVRWRPDSELEAVRFFDKDEEKSPEREEDGGSGDAADEEPLPSLPPGFGGSADGGPADRWMSRDYQAEFRRAQRGVGRPQTEWRTPDFIPDYLFAHALKQLPRPALGQESYEREHQRQRCAAVPPVYGPSPREPAGEPAPAPEQEEAPAPMDQPPPVLQPPPPQGYYQAPMHQHQHQMPYGGGGAP
eukprot:CAMPEP_0170137116 /NCGR_PEP_ID=MMETSP0033_2-20121228/3896_1 /TAXON_ID=195969 /ORGANISM="Dolichomastix tenuilepis, Strain CCMP3274" /LENGTH=678 /DNA_ID=CAMNT_0010372947 /DNA_START=312 /DNA_END=2345 /DNA_ORIENTATION=-